MRRALIQSVIYSLLPIRRRSKQCTPVPRGLLRCFVECTNAKTGVSLFICSRLWDMRALYVVTSAPGQRPPRNIRYLQRGSLRSTQRNGLKYCVKVLFVLLLERPIVALTQCISTLLTSAIGQCGVSLIQRLRSLDPLFRTAQRSLAVARGGKVTVKTRASPLTSQQRDLLEDAATRRDWIEALAVDFQPHQHLSGCFSIIP